MVYRSRHGKTLGGSHPMGRYSRETSKEWQNTPLEENEEEEAQLKALTGRKDKTQADEEVWERLMRNKEERHDRKNAPLAREIESYTEALNLEPFPPPLPKSSLWIEVQYPESYRLKDIREFYVACREGNMDAVRHWINEKKDALHQIGLDDGLACAARGDQVETCRFLLDNGAKLHGDVVRKACDNLSLPLFNLFFEHGYHPNQQIPSNRGGFGTALRHCLRSDDITRLLLEHGADPNAAPFNHDGRTLFWGARSTPPLDRRSGLALDLAVVRGSVDVVRMLLEHGANPKYSRPFWSLVCQRGGRLQRSPEAAEEWRPIMDLLVKYNSDVNGTNYGGGTALSAVIFRKRWDIVEYLLENGADPRVKTPCNGKDSLSLAAEKDDLKWEDSDEVQRYVSDFLSTRDGEFKETTPPEGALQNPLVQVMERVLEKRKASADNQ